jgi:hypothetical protein
VAFDADYFAKLNSEIVTDDEAESRSPESNSGVEALTQGTPTVPRDGTVISTGAPAAAVEKPASLPIPTHATNTRTIHHSTWHQQDDLLIYQITGSGFLHHMVRNLVGTFVEAGTGRISPDAIPTILSARNRAAAGPTAPARGLFLVEVAY